MKLTFIELPLFTSQLTQLADDHCLNQLQNDLLRNPEMGDLIPRLHGLRKLRVALPGRGKRGGARTIYLHLPEHHAVVLFYIYTKAKSEKLSPEQERRLRSAVDIIKKEFRHEKEAS